MQILDWKKLSIRRFPNRILLSVRKAGIQSEFFYSSHFKNHIYRVVLTIVEQIRLVAVEKVIVSMAHFVSDSVKSILVDLAAHFEAHVSPRISHSVSRSMAVDRLAEIAFFKN